TTLIEVGAVWLRRNPDGSVLALSATCPHLGCGIGADGKGGFICPCHASHFGADGSNVRGPSPRPMDPLPVKIEDGRVLVQPLRHRRQDAEDDLRRWLDERTGWPGQVARFFEERVPGGARWAYVFGSALVFLLLAQVLSGIGLAFSYSASVPAAWASVARIEQTGIGHLLRGLHAQGATFLLAVAGLHLLQTALFRAYRAPREVTWWLGLVLLALLLTFCLTGSLLPWDERGYWATRVT